MLSISKIQEDKNKTAKELLKEAQKIKKEFIIGWSESEVTEVLEAVKKTLKDVKGYNASAPLIDNIESQNLRPLPNNVENYNRITHIINELLDIAKTQNELYEKVVDFLIERTMERGEFPNKSLNPEEQRILIDFYTSTCMKKFSLFEYMAFLTGYNRKEIEEKPLVLRLLRELPEKQFVKLVTAYGIEEFDSVVTMENICTRECRDDKLCPPKKGYTLSDSFIRRIFKTKDYKSSWFCAKGSKEEDKENSYDYIRSMTHSFATLMGHSAPKFFEINYYPTRMSSCHPSGDDAGMCAHEDEDYKEKRYEIVESNSEYINSDWDSIYLKETLNRFIWLGFNMKQFKELLNLHLKDHPIYYKYSDYDKNKQRYCYNINVHEFIEDQIYDNIIEEDGSLKKTEIVNKFFEIMIPKGRPSFATNLVSLILETINEFSIHSSVFKVLQLYCENRINIDEFPSTIQELLKRFMEVSDSRRKSSGKIGWDQDGYQDGYQGTMGTRVFRYSYTEYYMDDSIKKFLTQAIGYLVSGSEEKIMSNFVDVSVSDRSSFIRISRRFMSCYIYDIPPHISEALLQLETRFLKEEHESIQKEGESIEIGKRIKNIEKAFSKIILDNNTILVPRLMLFIYNNLAKISKGVREYQRQSTDDDYYYSVTAESPPMDQHTYTDKNDFYLLKLNKSSLMDFQLYLSGKLENDNSCLSKFFMELIEKIGSYCYDSSNYRGHSLCKNICFEVDNHDLDKNKSFEFSEHGDILLIIRKDDMKKLNIEERLQFLEVLLQLKRPEDPRLYSGYTKTLTKTLTDSYEVEKRKYYKKIEFSRVLQKDLASELFLRAGSIIKRIGIDKISSRFTRKEITKFNLSNACISATSIFFLDQDFVAKHLLQLDKIEDLKNISLNSIDYKLVSKKLASESEKKIMEEGMTYLRNVILSSNKSKSLFDLNPTGQHTPYIVRPEFYAKVIEKHIIYVSESIAFGPQLSVATRYDIGKCISQLLREIISNNLLPESNTEAIEESIFHLSEMISLSFKNGSDINIMEKHTLYLSKVFFLNLKQLNLSSSVSVYEILPGVKLELDSVNEEHLEKLENEEHLEKLELDLCKAISVNFKFLPKSEAKIIAKCIFQLNEIISFMPKSSPGSEPPFYVSVIVSHILHLIKLISLSAELNQPKLDIQNYISCLGEVIEGKNLRSPSLIKKKYLLCLNRVISLSLSLLVKFHGEESVTEVMKQVDPRTLMDFSREVIDERASRIIFHNIKLMYAFHTGIKYVEAELEKQNLEPEEVDKKVIGGETKKTHLDNSSVEEGIKRQKTI